MNTPRFDHTPFAELATEEDFNARVSEAIRTTVGRADIVREGETTRERLIDFEDRTPIAFGAPREDTDGWTVTFEVGGIGRLLSEPYGKLPREDTIPCECRGELRIVHEDRTNSLGGNFSAEVPRMTITLGQTHRPD